MPIGPRSKFRSSYIGTPWAASPKGLLEKTWPFRSFWYEGDLAKTTCRDEGRWDHFSSQDLAISHATLVGQQNHPSGRSRLRLTSERRSAHPMQIYQKAGPAWSTAPGEVGRHMTQSSEAENDTENELLVERKRSF